MARIAFTSEIAELVGKLAGSVFQYSYGGYQIHSRVIPSNPQTDRQQLRRGWFGFVAASWRNLTPTEQLTFITAAGTEPAALRLFIGANVNNYLIDEPTITTYVGSSVPDPFQLDISDYSPGLLEIVAATALDTVPAGQKLLVFATFEKLLPKRFVGTSDYSPIVYFDEGTDLSSPIDIAAEWSALYGVMNGGARICINSVLIDKSNGNRGPDSIICSPPLITPTFQITDDNGDSIIDGNGDFVVYQ